AQGDRRQWHACPDPDGGPAAAGPHRLHRPDGADQHAARARVVRRGWRRSFIRLGFCAPPQTQDGDRSRPAPIPPDGTWGRLPTGLVRHRIACRVEQRLTMDAGRPAVRLFLLFLAVALPPLIAFAALSELAPTWLTRVGTGTALLIVALFAAGWAAVVGIVSSRLFRGDLQAILD